VHAGNRRSHEHAGERKEPATNSDAIEDYKRDRAGDHGGYNGAECEEWVVPDGDRQCQGHHADEVHAPNAECHGERAAVGPEKSVANPGVANALRDLDGDVTAERGDYDRENDQRDVVRLIHHAGLMDSE